jgi:hypothetical protein
MSVFPFFPIQLVFISITHTHPYPHIQLKVTLQCMDMVAEGALEEDTTNRAACGIVATFTAVVEGKEGVKSVDCSRFLLNVPVLSNDKPKLRVLFPPANRVGAMPQSETVLKQALVQTTVAEALKDFNL